MAIPRLLDTLRRLVLAALLEPAPVTPDSADPSRRHGVVTATVLVGAATMYWSLHLPAGDPKFYLATALLALVWVAGGRLSGPVATATPRTPNQHRLAQARWLPFALGILLLLLFLAGAVVVSQVPFLAGPVQQLLDHARIGSLPVVALVTTINGLSEEYFFRGALFQALPARWQVMGSTCIYAAVTASSGVPLLVLAGAMLGALVAMQRRATGGLAAGTITHLVWSLGMLFLLPGTLDTAARLLA